MPAKKLNKILYNTKLPSAKAEDCSIQEINPHEYLITNIDIFTPIHDDPYIMGKIAACNVTNDLFALNARNITNYSNFMGLTTDIPDKYGEKIIMGIKDFLKPLNAEINGGHTIYSPWPLFGGSASSIVKKEHLIRKTGVKSKDRLILTKPIGIQAIMAAYRVMNSNPSYLMDFNLEKIGKGIEFGVKLMTTSNQNITEVIHQGKFYSGIHAMTDVTGFGLIGHLEEVLYNSGFGALIYSFPVINDTIKLSEMFGYKLREGKSAEIAGGMLMSVSAEIYNDFTRALSDHGIWFYDIGKIISDTKIIRYSDEFKMVEIDGI